MRFMRVGDPGRETPVAVMEDGCLDLSPLTRDIDGAFLAAEPRTAVLAARDRGALPAIDIAGLRVGAPIARPQAVWCVGMNYAAHAAESGAQPPAAPVLFLKTPNTIVGPDDDVQIPRGSVRTDWEVELAVVIGQRAAYLDSPADARRHIAGYTIANDVSEREFQLERPGGQWSQGKCAATFNPLGPVLVTPDEFDPGDVRLRSYVNGEPRQDSSTADLIFGVEHVLWYISQVAVLEPGDVVNTGTPEGVALSGRFPYLTAGDAIELSIEGLGRQSQRVVAA